MSRWTIIIRGAADNAKAALWARNAKPGMRVEFKEAKRTNEQNDRMWAMLTDVACQVKYHGLTLTPDDFKLIFLDALKREVRMVPNIDGNGFVNLGRSSSDLSKQEMGDLMTLIEMFGAKNGVVFNEPEKAAA